jgi:hypothetical protein
VSLAAAAVIFGIVVGPIERAVAPSHQAPATVADSTPVAPEPRPAIVAQAPAAVTPTAPPAAVQTVDAAPGFGAPDKRPRVAAGAGARGRIVRARTRTTVPGHLPVLEAPEPQVASLTLALAEVDAEYSANFIPAAVLVHEPPAAPPPQASVPRIEPQAP